MGDRPRYSHRRGRYYDDEESDNSDVDNYPPPRPRAHPRDDRRPPPPPAQAPPQQVRRPSILVDPEETPSERDRRRPRRDSNVRLQTSDDGEDDYAPRSRHAPPPPRHDLEAKNGDEHRQFRAKRDGYESDEGQKLRHARKAPPAARGYPDSDDDSPAPRRQELPMRGKPREPAVEYGGAAIPSGEAPIRRRRTTNSAPKGGALRGIFQALKGPSTNSRGTYKDPPTSRRDDYDYDAPRRPERRRTEFDDPGYRSENARRRPAPPRQDRPRRDYDDHDYERPRRRPDEGAYRSSAERVQRPPRPQDYYSDHREDRAPRRGDPRRYPRDDRDRYDDRRRDPYAPRSRDADRRRSGAGGGSGGMNWQKEAGAAFMTYAMPTIKKEGTRFVKKELQKFLAGRGAGGA